jgi:hypothetical protein
VMYVPVEVVATISVHSVTGIYVKAVIPLNIRSPVLLELLSHPLFSKQVK